jgi:hypothetical protein
MKVLIPENTLLWTTKGFCFGKDISYGTEIFIINSNNELKPHPIIDDVDEPEEYLVYSLIFENQISTILPNYKIKNLENYFEVKTITEKNSFNLYDVEIINEFIGFQNEHSVEYSEKSPISAIAAKYLALCSISGREGTVEFERKDAEDASKFNVKIQNELKELSGVTTRQVVRRGNKLRNIEVQKIYYDSKKFYEVRKQIILKEDKISNIIYSNGYGIFSMFLRGLFEAGFLVHLDFSIRTSSKGEYPILNLPWNSKIRKLLQNTLIIENKFKLSSYKNVEHRNLNEVRLNFTGLDTIIQKILEIKHHKIKCYEIDIPMGTKMIMDNLIVKPYQISEDEKQELEKFEEVVEDDFKSIRRQIMSKATGGDITLFVSTNKISRSEKQYKIHVVGKFDRKGIVQTSHTRYGDTVKVTGMLHDETGEIKVMLWGGIAEKIQNNDILELNQAYSKNGILNNKQGGTEIIHKM